MRHSKPKFWLGCLLLPAWVLAQTPATVVTPPLQQPYGSELPVKGAVNKVGPVVVALPPADRSSECDDACLRTLMDRYLDALSRRDFTGLPTAPNLLVTENGRATRIGDDLWRVLEKLNPQRTYFTDPVTGCVLALTTLEESAHQPFIFLVRLKIENKLIAEVESMLTSDVNAAQHFRPDHVVPFDPVMSAALPDAQRPSRDQLIADANAMFFGGTPTLTAAQNCVHWENADRLALFGPCGTSEVARPGSPTYTNRAVRHVLVDPSRGLVVTILLKDMAPYLNPNPPDDERTPLFYQRPITMYLIQLARFGAGDQLLEQHLFMNVQEAGLSAVFLP